MDIQIRRATSCDLARLTEINRDAFANADVEKRLHPNKDKYPGDYYRTNYSCFALDYYTDDTVIMVAEAVAAPATTQPEQSSSPPSNDSDWQNTIVGWATWRWHAREEDKIGDDDDDDDDDDDAASNSSSPVKHLCRPKTDIFPAPSWKHALLVYIWAVLFKLSLLFDRSADHAFHDAREDAPETAVSEFRARDHPHKWILDWLVVDPRFQGRGVGRRLVEWGMNRCEEEEGEKAVVVLTAWPGTKGFFEKRFGMVAYRFFEVEELRWWMFSWMPGGMEGVCRQRLYRDAITDEEEEEQ